MTEITLKDLHPDVILFLLDYYGIKLEVSDGDPENPYSNVKNIRLTRGKCQVDQKVFLNGLVCSENLEATMKAATLNAIRGVLEAPYKLELDELKVKLENCHTELEKVYGPRWPDLKNWHNL